MAYFEEKIVLEEKIMYRGMRNVLFQIIILIDLTSRQRKITKFQ